MRRGFAGVVSAIVLVTLLAVPQPAHATSSPGITLGALPAAPAFDGQPCGHPASADWTCLHWNRCSFLNSCTGDAPDPTIAKAGAVYLAVTTGTALGNGLQVLESSSPDQGYHGWAQTTCDHGGQFEPCPQRWGSSAFGPNNTGLAKRDLPGSQTSPDLAFINGSWHLYFNSMTTKSAHNCLEVAVLNPAFAGPGKSVSIPTSTNDPIFKVASGPPLACSPPPQFAASTGLVDPSAVIDQGAPGGPAARLIYKANDGSSPAPAYLLSQALTSAGLKLTGPIAELLTNDTVHHPWEQTVENPSMIPDGSSWLLLFSAGLWYTSGYSEAVAVCQSPSGPCAQPSSRLLRSFPSAAGPAGGSFFQVGPSSYDMAIAAWDPSCIGYASDPQGSSPPGCTTGARRLFVVPVTVH